MTTELKPCPFCGGEARHYDSGPHIGCCACGARITCLDGGGTPSEHDMKCCLGCGKPIKEVPFKESE